MADWAPLLEWIKARGEAYRMPGDPLLMAVPARTFWSPDFLRSIPGVVLPDDRTGADPAHVYWASNREEAGQQLYAYKSRWLPASLLEPANRQRLVDALVAGAAEWTVSLHMNKGLAGGDPAAIARTRETAMNAEVCDAFALVIVAANDDPAWPGVPGHEPDPAEARRQAAQVDKAFAPIAAIAPGAGCYMSESDWTNPDYARDYWGANFPRLLAAKRKYDPQGLFGGHNCVGSS
jgi:FAD/FMN-containing dehydrogenase